ncbi:7794_t:CDS:1, partial [Funneliformis geosporum]
RTCPKKQDTCHLADGSSGDQFTQMRILPLDPDELKDQNAALSNFIMQL